MDISRFGNVPDVPPAPGLVMQSHDYDTPGKTVVVLGILRGGTSALAVMMAGLGIDMGSTYGTCEDVDILQALRRIRGDLADVIDKHNNHNLVWGFKDPVLIDHRQPEELHELLRNPYYMTIWRDPVAVAQTRLNMMESLRIDDAWHRTIKEQLRLAMFLQRLPDAPKLLVSYQRLLQQPERLCANLASFLGLTFSHQQIQQAVARVSPDGGYLIVPDPLRATL